MSMDKVCADLCAAIYDTASQWDHFDAGDDDGVCWATKKVGDTNYVVLRGSKTLADWILDGQAWAEPINHPELGPLHAGFARGLPHMWTECRALIPSGAKFVITGHSLGAGRACQLTGMAYIDDIIPYASVRFGEPRPGFAQLKEVLAESKVIQRSYRNAGYWGHDFVTDVPLCLSRIGLPYVHPAPMIDIDVHPTGDAIAQHGLFAGHHMPLYDAAFTD